MSISSTSLDATLTDLAAELAGDLHLPDDPGYALVATPWNLAIPSRPLAVAAVDSAEDVATAVRWARRTRVPVAVRATGHGAVDALDGTLLIHTGRLDAIEIGPTGSARIGAGVTSGALAATAAAEGFAPLAGSATTVGVVGLVTGGGLGPLSRSFGVCADRVTAFELVTGDGALRHVTAESEPELFWGLRGGKGALGVVTGIELDLLPDDPILGGCLFFDGADAAAVLHAWREWSATLPEEATTSVALMRLPDLPVIPPPLAGRLTVAVRFAWTGDEESGRQVLGPILAAAEPVLGGIGPMPASAAGAIHADPEAPTPSHERASMLDALPAEAVDALLAAAGPDSACSLLVVEIRQLGGRIAQAPSAPSVFPGRDVAFTLNAIGIAAGPLAARTDEDADRVAGAMTAWTSGRRMPNFEPVTDAQRVVDTYGAADVERLAALADEVDPDGIISAAEPVRRAAASLR